MTAERERSSDELIEQSTRSRARLAAVTAQLTWLVAELQREIDVDEDQEPD